MKQRNFRIFLFLLLVSIQFSHSQLVTVAGSIFDKETDSVLPNANVLAFPENEEEKTQFSITNHNGKYDLKLKRNLRYTLEISYLGYQTLETVIIATQDERKNFYLSSEASQLDEVTIVYKIPIEVKKDTITYDVDAFVTGQERKLREILDRLPGIEVDRQGNVTAQGRKVKKVLVEDKVFFTGNSKLAVNNIPAGAVDKIQLLDNYNEIEFLKDLQDTDELALNVKLKEDRKEFIFGDIEAGGGMESRYVLHPNIFFYSPNTTFNFIGDLNNIGKKSFTFSDYLDFNGGNSRVLTDIDGIVKLSNDDFSQFLLNDDFKASTNQFGAFNFRQSVTSKLELNSFLIANSSRNENESNLFNVYNYGNEPITENRTTKNSLNNFFLLGKLTIDYEPNRNTDLATNSFIKLSDNYNKGSILTVGDQFDDTFSSLSDMDEVEFNQNLDLNKRFSRAQTIHLESTYSFRKNTSNNTWQTQDQFLDVFLPLENDSNYNIIQLKESQSNNFNVILKDYWVLDNYNHVYTTIGGKYVSERYSTEELQRLSDNSINSFENDGFGNYVKYALTDNFFGLDYKFLTGVLTVKSGIYYHYYKWQNEQFGSTIINRTNVLLPEFNLEAEFNNGEKLSFRYGQRMHFPQSDQLATNFFLNSFNSVIRGNPFLQNERFHNFSLTYYKFSLFKRLNLNTGVFYNRKTESIKSTSSIEGIEQFVTYTMFNEPEQNISTYLNFSKKIRSLKFEINSRVSYNEFYQLVNSDIAKNYSNRLNIGGRVETLFENWPNFTLGYTYGPSFYKTNLSSATFVNKELSLNLDYNFLNDFKLIADYSWSEYLNKDLNQGNTFDLASFSLNYQKENNPWGFEISVTNLFNVQKKRRNYFSNYLITDQTIFIMPRIMLFKILYKL